MIEADEGVEEEFNIEVENVSTKNGLTVPVFNNKRPKMTSLNHGRRDENALKFPKTNSTSSMQCSYNNCYLKV